MNIQRWGDLVEVFYSSMIGSGKQFVCDDEMADNLLPINSGVIIAHRPYTASLREFRKTDTEVSVNYDRSVAKITIGDSHEGWMDAIRAFFIYLTHPMYQPLKVLQIDYNRISPLSEESCGYKPLQDMFMRFMDVILDAYQKNPRVLGGNYTKVSPIHIKDIQSIIGYNVVIGGVRQTYKPIEERPIAKVPEMTESEIEDYYVHDKKAVELGLALLKQSW